MPREEAVVSEETGEPRQARERRTARGSQGAGGSRRAVAEELVPKNLVPKNRDSTEVRPANAEAFKATRYRTLPFSLGNERGSCDTSKGVRESSQSREFETSSISMNRGQAPYSVTPGEV